jgi:bifunctional polynucleotide phosphatase/kinase
MKWSYYILSNKTLLIGRGHKTTTDKYACFDLDGTLICSKSGKKYIQNKNDWKFIYSNVVETLRKLYKSNFQIVIFTNQAGIKIMGIQNWKQMIENIIENVDIKITIYSALSHDLYRKPYPTMWEIFRGSKKVHSKSFYCGDACGRICDIGDSDYKFAINCSLNFYTPEMIFSIINYDVPKLSFLIDFDKYLTQKNKKIELLDKDMIILTGNYKSGKTHFVNKFLIPNYTIINSKTSKNILQETIDLNKSIVIDENNWTIKKRKKYIEIAKLNNYSCRCIDFICPISISMHNARYDHYMTKNNILPDALHLFH